VGKETAPGPQEQRFAAYIEGLAEAAGHADRHTPLKNYCTGLLLPGERKSVEPMAARLAGDNVRRMHQSLHHVVADAPWSDEAVLDRSLDVVIPAMLRRDPIVAWVVDDTGFPKKGRESVGVLQTEDYMRVLFRNSRRGLSDAEVDQGVKARLFRQRRLTTEPALELVGIVDESVLRRAVGGVEVMRAQLQHILARAALPSVCLHMLPFSLGAHAGMSGSFIVLGFDDPDEPEIAYVEHTAKTLHLEKESDVQACKLAFDQLQSQALSPHDSAAFIERLVADL
jgi:hypothetical protein